MSVAWTDLSVGFPDVPATDIVVAGNKLVVGTDLGVLVADRRASATNVRWKRVGFNPGSASSALPLTAVYRAAPRPGRSALRRDPWPRHLEDPDRSIVRRAGWSAGNPADHPARPMVMAHKRSVVPVAFLLVLVACSTDDGERSTSARGTAPSTSASSPPPTAAGSPVPSPTLAPTPPAAGVTSSKPGSAPRATTPAPEPPMPNRDDRPGDRVRGHRTLVGTVERGELCPLLRVGTDRWALVGALARRLSPGDTVEVRGTVTTAPRGCPAARAITISQLNPR